MASFSNSPAALLPQPALLVGIEEGVHQIIAIVLGYFEWLRSYAEAAGTTLPLYESTKLPFHFAVIMWLLCLAKTGQELCANYSYTSGTHGSRWRIPQKSPKIPIP